MPNMGAPEGYALLLKEVKARVRQGQVRAVLAANRELLHLYWDIGRIISLRQASEGWGAGVIPRLARDMAKELPDISGFSERNLKRMVRFFTEYQGVGEGFSFMPQPVAQLGGDSDEIWSLPWGHHFLLIERIHDRTLRTW